MSSTLWPQRQPMGCQLLKPYARQKLVALRCALNRSGRASGCVRSAVSVGSGYIRWAPLLPSAATRQTSYYAKCRTFLRSDCAAVHAQRGPICMDASPRYQMPSCGTVSRAQITAVCADNPQSGTDTPHATCYPCHPLFENVSKNKLRMSCDS